MSCYFPGDLPSAKTPGDKEAEVRKEGAEGVWLTSGCDVSQVSRAAVLWRSLIGYCKSWVLSVTRVTAQSFRRCSKELQISKREGIE